jgi:hypothetical protein
VITRMSSDPRTQRYVERRSKEGKSTAEIVRVLKRYVAREVFKHLPAPRHRLSDRTRGRVWPTNRLPRPNCPANETPARPPHPKPLTSRRATA